MSEVLAPFNLHYCVHFVVLQTLAFRFRLGRILSSSFQVEKRNVLFGIFLRSTFLRVLLEERRGWTIDIAILVMGHGGVEAFAMRLALEDGEKLFLHV